MPTHRGLILVAFVALICSTPMAARQAAEKSSFDLEALSGEYTNAAEPDTPFSFYPQDGKLVMESDRLVPTPLKSISATEFAVPGMDIKLTFTVNSRGMGEAVGFSSAPGAVFKRTGAAVHHVFHDYRRSEAMIPMRDGVKLHAVILKPADIKTPLPILLMRTPYGVDGTTDATFFGERPELARAGYIYVAEDIRGRYKSQGKFVMMRPLTDHRNAEATDESTDAYDTVAWLVKHVPGNNGRVGALGTSYPGFLAMMAGIDPNPHVKAISPQAPMIDVWMGDDFFHNGAFRQSYGYDYVLMMESSKERTQVSYGKAKDGDPVDGYDFFLERGNFAEDVKKSGAKVLPTWKLFLNHPAYDGVWRSRGVEWELDKVAVPTLTVGGYYDQEDMYGPQEEYAMLEPHDTGHDNFLVLGPWRHGYWSSSSRHLGDLDYGQPIGDEFRKDILAKFFEHYLKDVPGEDPSGFDLRDTASFQTGSDTWKHYSQFPPLDSRPTILYLGGNTRLSWTAPAATVETTYVSNPADPVPYRHRPIQPTYSQGSHWYDWMTEDQRFVTDRKDVAVWRLPVLKHDLTLTGNVTADIYAATTGSDNDLVVKLIDEYPEDAQDPKMRGYELMTNAEIFRGRYLSGFDNAQPLRPDKIYEYRFSLHDVDHVFEAGHTVMVEIQSTWFPLYDRNPQTFVPNIMKAPAEAYKPEAITIYSGPGHESNLKVPVVSPSAESGRD
ncbi:MAG TPA: CocE/NonD family hydrolase [Terracidiphilus sp.]|nr:CocE/NonD family hydrolase [Terracidiphilus sp.]